MGQLHYLSETRLRRALARGDAQVTVDNRHGDIAGVPERYAGAFLTLKVGLGLTPRAPVTCTPEGWSAPLSFSGVHAHVVVPWVRTVYVEPMSPPPGGGRPVRRAA